MKKLYIYLLPVLIVLSGCATNQSTFIPVMPSADKGSVVYIYRSNSFSNVAISPSVIINGKERFLIKNDRYTFVYMLPGKHMFKLNLDEHYQGDFEQPLDVKPDQTYFLRVDTAMQFVQGQPYVRSFNLKEVAGEIGLADLRECRYVKAEMPSKYIWKKGESASEPRFTTEKTSDPFSRNK